MQTLIERLERKIREAESMRVSEQRRRYGTDGIQTLKLSLYIARRESGKEYHANRAA